MVGAFSAASPSPLRRLLFVFAVVAFFAMPRAEAAPRIRPVSHSGIPHNQADKVIRATLQTGRLSELRWPDFSDYRLQVENFYRTSNYAPAWIADGQLVPNAGTMIRVLVQSDRAGLNPDDYDGPRWARRVAQLSLPHSTQDEAQFDVALTVSAMRYISDVSVGRLNRKHLQFAFDLGPNKLDLPSCLRKLVSDSSDLETHIASLEPQSAGYEVTREALLRYMQLAKQDDGEQLPPPPGFVFPGGLYDGIPRLARLLRLVGDLPQDAVLPKNPKLYDGEIVDAVRRFQRRHGLPVDGYLTRQTIEQLNVPLSSRIEQLQLTLEQYRWMHFSSNQPRIVINLPEFRLTAYDDTGHVALSMKVNVGEAADFQTPVLQNDVRFLVFRPYWNVPPRILRNEVIVDTAADRHYIRDNNMEVVTRSGTVVTSGVITDGILNQLRSGKLLVRQKPGPMNALGLLKIIFPNRHHVYLHDTPQSADMFSFDLRTLSHGCIQLQHPADLALWLLRDQPGWDAARIEHAMHQGPDNFPIDLTKPVPILIVYRTTTVLDGGEVHFYQDVYGRDASLKKALAKKYSDPKQRHPEI